MLTAPPLLSISSRSSDSSVAEWWPGGIHSPQVYYHLRARQLRYAQKFPQQAGISFRGPREVHTQQSMLLNRRRQGPLAVLVPAIYTNVNQNDSSVHYLGDKVVQLTTKPAIVVAPAPRPSAVASAAAAAAAAAAIKRVIETPTSPSRATWTHPDDCTENMLISRRSSGSSITTCGMALDPKRRCTIQGGGSNNGVAVTTSFLPAGHFIARNSPSPTASPPRVYPGIVLQQNNNTCQQFQHQQQHQLHTSFSGNSGLTPATLLGTITPPLASMDPLSAGSDSSSTSIASMSTRGSADLAMATTAPWSSPPMPTHAAAVWELTSASAQPAMVDQSATVPFLSMVHNTNNLYSNGQNIHQYHQDPTMQQYYTRQYNIKQEQAFPCHQVVEIGSNTISAIGGYITGNGNNNVSQVELEDQEDAAAAGSDVGGWAVGLLRSLAGSIKRSVSP